MLAVIKVFIQELVARSLSLFMLRAIGPSFYSVCRADWSKSVVNHTLGPYDYEGSLRGKTHIYKPV